MSPTTDVDSERWIGPEPSGRPTSARCLGLLLTPHGFLFRIFADYLSLHRGCWNAAGRWGMLSHGSTHSNLDLFTQSPAAVRHRQHRV
jgi:hypothetical protein